MSEKKNTEHFSIEKLLSSRPENLHKGTKGSNPDSCDIGEMVDKSPCAKEYYALEECLGEHDRNWTKCQKEVHALKSCSVDPQKKK